MKWTRWMRSRVLTLMIAVIISPTMAAPSVFALGETSHLRPLATGLSGMGGELSKAILRRTFLPGYQFSERVFQQTGVVLIDRRAVENDPGLVLAIEDYLEQVASRLSVPVEQAAQAAGIKLAWYDPEASTREEATQGLQTLSQNIHRFTTDALTEAEVDILRLNPAWFTGGIVYGSTAEAVLSQLGERRALTVPPATPITSEGAETQAFQGWVESLQTLTTRPYYQLSPADRKLVDPVIDLLIQQVPGEGRELQRVALSDLVAEVYLRKRVEEEDVRRLTRLGVEESIAWAVLLRAATSTAMADSARGDALEEQDKLVITWLNKFLPKDKPLTPEQERRVIAHLDVMRPDEGFVELNEETARFLLNVVAPGDSGSPHAQLPLFSDQTKTPLVRGGAPAQFVRYEVNEQLGLGTIQIDRSPVNAVNPQLLDELEQALRAAQTDSRVRVIALTGTGKAFVGGADVSRYIGISREDKLEWVKRGQRLMSLIETSERPVIAAINGYALGGGLELALSTRYRIAVKSARFAAPEITVGFNPAWGMTQRLPRLVGPAKAIPIMLPAHTTDTITAEEAKAIGLVDEVVEDEAALRSRVQALAATPEQLPSRKDWDALAARQQEALQELFKTPSIQALRGNFHNALLEGKLQPGGHVYEAEHRAWVARVILWLIEKGYTEGMQKGLDWEAQWNSELTVSAGGQLAIERFLDTTDKRTLPRIPLLPPAPRGGAPVTVADQHGILSQKLARLDEELFPVPATKLRLAATTHLWLTSRRDLNIADQRGVAQAAFEAFDLSHQWGEEVGEAALIHPGRNPRLQELGVREGQEELFVAILREVFSAVNAYAQALTQTAGGAQALLRQVDAIQTVRQVRGFWFGVVEDPSRPRANLVVKFQDGSKPLNGGRDYFLNVAPPEQPVVQRYYSPEQRHLEVTLGPIEAAPRGGAPVTPTQTPNRYLAELTKFLGAAVISANRGFSSEGKLLSLLIDPRWNAEEPASLDVLVTAYVFGHAAPGWGEVRVAIIDEGTGQRVAVQPLDRRGQAIFHRVDREARYHFEVVSAPTVADDVAQRAKRRMADVLTKELELSTPLLAGEVTGSLHALILRRRDVQPMDWLVISPALAQGLADEFGIPEKFRGQIERKLDLSNLQIQTTAEQVVDYLLELMRLTTSGRGGAPAGKAITLRLPGIGVGDILRGSDAHRAMLAQIASANKRSLDENHPGWLRQMGDLLYRHGRPPFMTGDARAAQQVKLLSDLGEVLSNGEGAAGIAKLGLTVSPQMPEYEGKPIKNIEVMLVDLGTQTHFGDLFEGGAYELSDYDEGSGTLKIYMTEQYVETYFKRTNTSAITETALHPLLEIVFGLTHQEAILSLWWYNALSLEENGELRGHEILSDVHRVVLEEIGQLAQHGDPRAMQYLLSLVLTIPQALPADSRRILQAEPLQRPLKWIDALERSYVDTAKRIAQFVQRWVKIIEIDGRRYTYVGDHFVSYEEMPDTVEEGAESRFASEQVNQALGRLQPLIDVFRSEEFGGVTALVPTVVRSSTDQPMPLVPYRGEKRLLVPPNNIVVGRSPKASGTVIGVNVTPGPTFVHLTLLVPKKVEGYRVVGALRAAGIQVQATEASSMVQDVNATAVVDADTLMVKEVDGLGSLIDFKIFYDTGEGGVVRGSLMEPSKFADGLHLKRPIRVAINGAGGRTGLTILRQLLLHHRPDQIQVVAVNARSAEYLKYALQHDTEHGEFPLPIELGKDETGDWLEIQGQRIWVYSQRTLKGLPWARHEVDIAVDATGEFISKEALAGHLEAGAKRVILTNPSEAKKDEEHKADFSLLLGVNEDQLPADAEVIDCASCTTNSYVPPMSIAKQGPFRVLAGVLGTTHAVTGTQRLTDGFDKRRERGRAAPRNMVLTETGADRATVPILPDLGGKLSGTALRVPTGTGSISVVTNIVEVPAGMLLTAEGVNEHFRKLAATEPLRGILAVEAGLVGSQQIVGRSESSIMLEEGTQVTPLGENRYLVRQLFWYDNEWGYSARVVDAIYVVGAKLIEAETTTLLTLGEIAARAKPAIAEALDVKPEEVTGDVGGRLLRSRNPHRTAPEWLAAQYQPMALALAEEFGIPQEKRDEFARGLLQQHKFEEQIVPYLGKTLAALRAGGPRGGAGTEVEKRVAYVGLRDQAQALNGSTLVTAVIDVPQMPTAQPVSYSYGAVAFDVALEAVAAGEAVATGDWLPQPIVGRPDVTQVDPKTVVVEAVPVEARVGEFIATYRRFARSG